jgi:Reverse transcriptase (RNA-dependent DNA polymerase)/RNase H-like domain found in reverse transcriptase
MPFSLTNGPAVFQHLMNDVFGDMLDVCVVVYLNDILIYSNNLSQHREHVHEVLRCLHVYNLYAKHEKCEWHRDSVQFLSYTVYSWPKDLPCQRYTILPQFCQLHCFIHNYSGITVPLTRLTRKGIPWVFTGECQRSFEFLMKAFTSPPVLLHWVPNQPLVVEIDASDYALGAILSMFDTSNELHLVTFHSQTFSSPNLIMMSMIRGYRVLQVLHNLYAV